MRTSGALQRPAGPSVARLPYRWTALLLAVTAALAPAYTLRWHLGFYPTTVLEDAILLTLLVFVLEHLRDGRPGLSWRSPFLIPAILFVVAGALAVVTAPGLTAALGLYRAYILEPLAIGLLVVNVVRTPERAFRVALGLFAGAAVAGLANSVVVGLALAHHAYDVTQTPPVVIYLTANAVALYAVPVAALAGALALHGSGLARLSGALFFGLAVVITVLSFSRGGYLALAAVALGLVISSRRRLPLIGLAAVGAALLSLVPPVRTRVLIETQNVYGNTIQSRLDLWSGTLRFLRQRPLFGAGLSGFHDRVGPYITHLHTPANFIDPHNILLNFWVETGLLGLLSMAWILGAALVAGWRGWHVADAGWRPYELGAMLAMVAVVVHGLVDVPYFKNDLSLEFWTLVGILWAGRLWGAAGGHGDPARAGLSPWRASRSSPRRPPPRGRPPEPR
jgi:putative inorganic carbon (hco3(-)) transporter